jgi:hypothetical protein
MDSYVLSLDVNEKVLFVYLITNERNNLIGCYELPDELIEFQLRMNKSEINRIKRKFEDDRKMVFEQGWVYLINHHKYQKYNKKTHIIAIAKQWALVPGFIKSKLDTLSIEYAYPMHTPKKQNQKPKTKNQIQKGESPRGEYTPAFDKFWDSYPRKVGKGAAFRDWKKIKSRNDTEILTALEQQKKQDQWQRNNGQYVPHPTTWINQRRWEDEVQDSPKREVIDIQ